jgi:hypothetical protein
MFILSRVIVKTFISTVREVNSIESKAMYPVIIMFRPQQISREKGD